VANGKVVVITGASHGIGASLVSVYSEAAYNVVANALAIEPVKIFLKMLSSKPSLLIFSLLMMF
jgi:NAD(P)-dependent dehydrogenase (short-subunit alcohol dehydrogenase family)